jgi:hypothetical protein
MEDYIKIGDMVNYNGGIVITEDGFLWEELYEDLEENNSYKVSAITIRYDECFYFIMGAWYPSSVFYFSKENFSKKYGLK